LNKDAENLKKKKKNSILENDCGSGLCIAGVMEERPFEPRPMMARLPGTEAHSPENESSPVHKSQENL
jgi:hypothetical protein